MFDKWYRFQDLANQQEEPMFPPPLAASLHCVAWVGSLLSERGSGSGRTSNRGVRVRREGDSVLFSAKVPALEKT